MASEAYTTGRLQVVAGASLLGYSKLVSWDRNRSQFDSVSHDVFTEFWRSDVHPVFGRLICWIAFAAGAEFLAKGLCLLNGVDIRRNHAVLQYPSQPLHRWAQDVIAGRASKVRVLHFGELGGLCYPRGQSPSALELLSSNLGLPKADQDMLIAAYRLLAGAIRNRDAHAYRPNERDAHFWLVNDLFTPCLNLLVAHLPTGSPVLTSWIDGAE